MNFVYINQHVLNNLLYILSSIFIFYFIYDSGRYLKKYKKTTYYTLYEYPSYFMYALSYLYG